MSEHTSPMAAKICALIDIFYEKKDGAVLRELLMTLMDASIVVPMNVFMEEADEQQFLNASPGDTVTTKGQIRMKPDMLKNSQGELLFPVFTGQEEAPEDYRKFFSWVTMDFMRCARSAFHKEDCSGIVVNAFSRPFPINKLLLQVMINQADCESNGK